MLSEDGGETLNERKKRKDEASTCKGSDKLNRLREKRSADLVRACGKGEKDFTRRREKGELQEE